jgi:peptide/nickel transport system permease protein
LSVGIAIVVLAVAASLLAIWFTPYAPNGLDLASRLQAPSLSHLMGTDEFGRDIFSRVLVALRLDLLAISVVTYVPLVIGMSVGMIAGYYRGKIDTVLMRVVDGVIAFPFLVLILAVVSATGPGLKGYYIGVLVVGWAPYARLTRGEMLVLREQQFILAAQTLAYSTKRILFRHAMPNLIRPNLVFSAADLVLNLVLLAGLSYLGLGIQPPRPELGALVAQGQDVLLQAWWVTALPGLVIVVLGAGFSMIGDGLGERLGSNFNLSV